MDGERRWRRTPFVVSNFLTAQLLDYLAGLFTCTPDSGVCSLNAHAESGPRQTERQSKVRMSNRIRPPVHKMSYDHYHFPPFCFQQYNNVRECGWCHFRYFYSRI